MLCCSSVSLVASPAGAGADYVMLGGMFAGHDQSGGQLIERDGKKLKQFYGMSSAVAMQKHQGGVKDYRWGGGGDTLFITALSLSLAAGHLRARQWSWRTVAMSIARCRTSWEDCALHALTSAPRS